MLRSAILCSLGILGVAACGATHGSSVVPTTAAASSPAASVSGGQAGFADTGPQGSVITFIVKPGADAQAVGHRIAGPDARAVPAVQSMQPNPPSGVAPGRTLVVSVDPGQEQEALHRARSDPDVQQAYLAKNLGG